MPPIDLTVYRDFLETAPDAMVVIDAEGIIRLANAQAATLFGKDRESLLGQPIEVLLPERLRQYHVAHRRAYMANPHSRPMGTGMELWAEGPDGREIPVEISLSPIMAREGQHVTAAIRDISARKQVETALRVAKEAAERANETKSRFLAAASHDLRQPLQALRMHLTALGAAADDEVLRTSISRKMTHAVNGLTDILDTLLDIARLDMNQVQPSSEAFDLEELFRDLLEQVEPMIEEKGLALRHVPTRLMVRSDRGLLTRVVGNLIANAVRYTESGRVLVGCRRLGDHLRIEVWDSGPGIPPEAHEAIFEEYVQLGNNARQRKHGLGLGLSIVRRLATLLDHPVSVRSWPGRGSVFAIDVPVASRTDAGLPARRAAGADIPAGARVLFIEDDPEVREATAMILKLKGFEVRTAGSGEEAYAGLDEDAEAPDLILSDFRLPGRENGAQVVQRVRTLLDREVPVVFMTGDTSEARIRETRMAYCDVLRKPIDGDKLLRALHEALAHRPGHA